MHPQLTFARFYLPNLVPHAEKAIYVDDDIIVQGMGRFLPTLFATGICWVQYATSDSSHALLLQGKM